MTPDQFQQAAALLYPGERRWKSLLAADLQTDRSSVSRYASGAVAIPGPVEVVIRLLLERRGLA